MIVYSIRNKINGKYYVGQTIKSLEFRIQGHLKCAKAKVDRKLYNAINKYGWENFEVKIECYCSSIEEMNKKETEYIIKYNSVKCGYNMGYGGDNNVMFCEETRAKHDAKMRSKEVREKISKSMKESIARKGGVSEKTRKKISLKLKGNQHGKGKKRPLSAIIATNEKKYKPVYCMDSNNIFIKQFRSVKDGAQWWYENDDNPSPSGFKIYCDTIKDSFVNHKCIKGLYWYYGTYSV